MVSFMLLRMTLFMHNIILVKELSIALSSFMNKLINSTSELVTSVY